MKVKHLLRHHHTLDECTPPPLLLLLFLTKKNKDKLPRAGLSLHAWTCAASLTNVISLNPHNNPGGGDSYPVLQTRVQTGSVVKPHCLRVGESECKKEVGPTPRLGLLTAATPSAAVTCEVFREGTQARDKGNRLTHHEHPPCAPLPAISNVCVTRNFFKNHRFLGSPSN